MDNEKQAIDKIMGGLGFPSMWAKTHSTLTESDLYAMGMESPTAWHKMKELCALAGVPYPPEFERGKPAPVTLACENLEN